ncbi:MAG: DUF1638 domain-containing protein [Planctomycetaceae bacterium]|nr:DUF1638 domain-containing protein [Planctomycetaceae bacterium]
MSVYKFIGCEIVYREACLLAARSVHQVDVEFLRKGLHDLERADMIARVQAAVDAADAEGRYEAILLGYARCNDGLVGLTARTRPLVIPRAHDCVTFFFGSRGAYQEYFDAHPGTYYMTTGWSERNVTPGAGYDRPAYDRQGVMGKLGLADDYEGMVAKYGKENADFILESLGDWTKNYTRFCYLQMGVCDESAAIAKTRSEADQRHWDFELRRGDWTLLEKLFAGRWDDDFVIVPPGRRLVARNDGGVLGVE